MALTLSGDDGVAGVNGSATTPAIQGTDTNTGLTFGTDTVNVVTGGNTRTTVDSSGRLLVGTSSQFGTSSRSSFYSFLQVEGNTSGSTGDGRITLGTGATTGSNTGLGSIYFCDTDGGDRALIRGFSTSAGGSENYPGYLTFWTNSGAANPTEQMRLTSTGDLRFNSGYGSVATAYGVRAWVQFQGSNGTINADGNVSSVTRSTTGQYWVNFTNSMPDDDYAAVCSSKGSWNLLATHTVETGRVQILAVNQSFNYSDHTFISVVIIR